MTTAIILVILGGWVLITAFVLVVACMFSSRLTQRSRTETLKATPPGAKFKQSLSEIFSKSVGGRTDGNCRIPGQSQR